MRPQFKTLLIALVTIGLLAWFLRQANFGAVWHEIRTVRPWALALAFGSTLSTYLLRAYRWQYLLQPIGRTHFALAFRTTVIGFAANTVLPARVGEVLRPYLLARRENLSVSATFATIILERLLDLLTVLLLFGLFVLLFDKGVSTLDPKTFTAVKWGGLAFGGASVAAFLVIAFLSRRPGLVTVIVQGIARLLPARFSEAFQHIAHAFVEGLAVTREPSRLVGAVALSIPLWVSIASGIWFVTVAFNMTIPFTGSFLITALLAVGVAVPTPGAVGGFHEAFRIGVTNFYGIANDRAVAGAIVLHAISFIPVTLLGSWFMFRDGLSFAGVQHIREEAAHEEHKDDVPVTGATGGRPGESKS
jgi:uncharacterized protein (TIRG00374 family)